MRKIIGLIAGILLITGCGRSSQNTHALSDDNSSSIFQVESNSDENKQQKNESIMLFMQK